MNPTLAIGALVGALGCAPRVELPDVPIVGGTPETRRAVQGELERFDAWIGPGRLRIREVRFDELHEPLAGQWKQGRGLVRVEMDVPTAEVADVVRHELCHALDDSEQLSSRRSAFAHLGRAYPQYDLQAGEAFAVFCAAGPLAAAAAAAATCGDDPDPLAALSFLADEVWTGDVPRGAAAPLGDTRGGFALDQVFEPVDSWIVLPTEDADRVRIQLAVEVGGVAVVEADLLTGAQLPSQHHDLAPEADTPPAGLSYGAPAVFGRRGWPEGPGAALLTWPMRNQPWLPPRLVVHDGDAWRPVADTCPGDEGISSGLFTALDQIWYAWGDGETISWAPVIAP